MCFQVNAHLYFNSSVHWLVIFSFSVVLYTWRPLGDKRLLEWLSVGIDWCHWTCDLNKLRLVLLLVLHFLWYLNFDFIDQSTSNALIFITLPVQNLVGESDIICPVITFLLYVFIAFFVLHLLVNRTELVLKPDFNHNRNHKSVDHVRAWVVTLVFVFIWTHDANGLVWVQLLVMAIELFVVFKCWIWFALLVLFDLGKLFS